MAPFEQAHKWLACVTYKSGWSFSVISLDGRLGCSIEVRTHSSYHPSKWTVVTQSFFMPNFVEEASMFFTVLRSEILRLEAHEVDEWLRVDGTLLNDPHEVNA